MKDLELAKGKRSVFIEEMRLATIVTRLDELVDSLLLSKENQSSLTMKEEIELTLTNKEDFNIDFDFDRLLKLLNCNEVPFGLKNRLDFSNRLKTDYNFKCTIDSARSDYFRKFYELFGLFSIDSSVQDEVRTIVKDLLFNYLIANYNHKQWKIYYDFETKTLSTNSVGNKIFICNFAAGFKKGKAKLLTEKFFNKNLDYKTVIKNEIKFGLESVIHRLSTLTTHNVNDAIKTSVPLELFGEDELMEFINSISFKKAKSILKTRSDKEQEFLLKLMVKALKE
mgnify:FL=1